MSAKCGIGFVRVSMSEVAVTSRGMAAEPRLPIGAGLVAANNSSVGTGNSNFNNQAEIGMAHKIRLAHMMPCLSSLQAARPRAIVDLIRSAEQFRVPGGSGSGSSSTGGKAVALPQPGNCQRCGYISSQVRGCRGCCCGTCCVRLKHVPPCNCQLAWVSRYLARIGSACLHCFGFRTPIHCSRCARPAYCWRGSTRGCRAWGSAGQGAHLRAQQQRQQQQRTQQQQMGCPRQLVRQRMRR